MPILSYKRGTEWCADMAQKLGQADYITTVEKFLGAKDLTGFAIILAKKDLTTAESMYTVFGKNVYIIFSR